MIGIVTGLTVEARCWEDKHPLLIHCAGQGARQATQAAVSLIQQGVTGLVSFGLAGGLMPALRPGTVVLANAIIVPTSDGQRLFFPHPSWHERLHTRLTALAPLTVPIAASDSVIATVGARMRLAADTGAGAVDMESGAVALCAIMAGLPFLVVRVTADPAERTLPPAIFSSVDTHGRLHPMWVLRALAQQPTQWPDWLHLLRDSYHAFAVLRRVVKLAGADCAFLP
ncbi:Adenosylhopane nucleosidase, HpnG [invertebrate metagenome]|uniref:Adenosylhopane nucleosidase, HpnG n=1 Tax=invertebrate metagenome TaxID=1711999 RepID=A0A484H6P5_9ZZZZ